MIRNAAGQVAGAQVNNATTGAGFVGVVTCYVTGDGGTQTIGSVGSGLATDEGNGYYTYRPSAAETNYTTVAFTFTGTGAIPGSTTYDTFTVAQNASVNVPPTVSSITAQQLIQDALIMTGALAQGESPGAGDVNDAFRRLNRMISGWKNQRLTCFVVEENVYPLVASQQEYTIGPGGDFDQFRPQFLSYCGLILTTPSPAIEIKVPIITVKDWSYQSVKAQTSTQPTRIYYYTQFPSTGAEAGMGKLIFWPVPTDVNSVRLYCPKPIEKFANLSTSYVLPEGYEDALEYNLAVRLIQAGMGLREHLSDLVPMARDTLAIIKRANVQPVTASIDPALWPKQPGWNWRTGSVN